LVFIISACIAPVWGYTPAPIGAISVATFGAKGDGVTDDGPALAKACVSLKTGQSLAFEPGKTYLISQTLRVEGKINFNIYGQDAKIKTLPNFNRVAGGAFLIKYCKLFTICDLTIDGNRQQIMPNGESWSHHNLYFLTCKSFTVKSVHSNNACNDGFYVATASNETDTAQICKDGTFLNCSADNAFRQGMSIIMAYNTKVIGGSYTNTNGTDPRSGIDVEANPGAYEPGNLNISFSGVSFVGNEGHGLLVVQVAGTKNITVDGCYFNNNKGCGVSTYAPYVTIKNNILYNYPTFRAVLSSNIPGIIGVARGANNCIVTNNTIANVKNGQTCINIAGLAATVSGNKIYDFSAIAISPTTYSAGNDIQKTKVIPDPGPPAGSSLIFNPSPSIIRVNSSSGFSMTSSYNTLNFRMNLNQGGDFSLITYNMAGQKIWEKNLENSSKGIMQIPFNKSILKNGAYITSFTGNSVHSVIKYTVVE
jgi:hypothetical protein